MNLSKRIKHGCIAALTLLLSAIAAAELTVSGGFLAPTPKALRATLQFPQVDATAWLLFDHETGWILGAHNAELEIEPASLTKIMTAHVVIEEINQGRVSPEALVTVSEKAWRMGGSRMFIEAGQSVSVDELLKGLIIQSGNDAAVALAEFIAGSESAFAQIMNAKADDLGMKNTHFKNASGWPEEGHYTSVYDLALLSRAVVDGEGEYYDLYAVREFEFGGIKQRNRNSLLGKVMGVDGIKTGHTQAAGYCLIGSAKRATRRITSIVVGSSSEKSREQAVSSLLEYGFKQYKSYILSPEQKVYDMMLYGGKENNVPLSVVSYAEIPVGIDQYNNVQLIPVVPDDVFAPVAKGDIFGSVEVKVAEESVFSIPLMAMNEAEKGSIWSRFIDWIRYLLR